MNKSLLFNPSGNVLNVYMDADWVGSDKDKLVVLFSMFWSRSDDEIHEKNVTLHFCSRSFNITFKK